MAMSLSKAKAIMGFDIGGPTNSGLLHNLVLSEPPRPRALIECKTILWHKCIEAGHTFDITELTGAATSDKNNIISLASLLPKLFVYQTNFNSSLIIPPIVYPIITILHKTAIILLLS